MITKYADFRGRSSRKEYWVIILLYVILASLFNGFRTFFSYIDLDILNFINLIYLLYTLGVIVPYYAVSVRRMHDCGRSGYWAIINWNPVSNFLVAFTQIVLDVDEFPILYVNISRVLIIGVLWFYILALGKSVILEDTIINVVAQTEHSSDT